MSQYSSNPAQDILGKSSRDRTRTAVRELAEAIAKEKKKSIDFSVRYGQEQSGKASSYAEEHALYGRDGEAGRNGVVYDTGRFGHSVRYDKDNPNVMIRRKKRFLTETEKHVQEIPGSKDSNGDPKVFVSKLVKQSRRTSVTSEFDSESKLVKKTKSLSRGRKKEDWELDTRGRLIRTRYETERLRDGVIFSPRSEKISELKEDGTRKVENKKGWRVNYFDRDEETGKLTHTGKKGLISESKVEFNTDGSVAKTSVNKGILFRRNIEYLGENLKKVTSKKLFSRKETIKTVELTKEEKAQQQKLREAKQASLKQNTKLQSETKSQLSDKNNPSKNQHMPGLTAQQKNVRGEPETTASSQAPLPYPKVGDNTQLAWPEVRGTSSHQAERQSGAAIQQKSDRGEPAATASLPSSLPYPKIEDNTQLAWPEVRGASSQKPEQRVTRLQQRSSSTSSNRGQEQPPRLEPATISKTVNTSETASARPSSTKEQEALADFRNDPPSRFARAPTSKQVFPPNSSRNFDRPKDDIVR